MASGPTAVVRRSSKGALFRTVSAKTRVVSCRARNSALNGEKLDSGAVDFEFL